MESGADLKAKAEAIAVANSEHLECSSNEKAKKQQADLMQVFAAGIVRVLQDGLSQAVSAIMNNDSLKL